MEDVEEEQILKQAIYSQMKFTIRIFSNSYVKSALLRPEFLFFLSIFFILCFYLQAIELGNAFGFITNRISNSLRFKSSSSSFTISSALEQQDSLDEVKNQSACYSIQGRRLTQEDRFIVQENINGSTRTSFFAIFDGHGGDYASQFAKDILVKNLYNKIIEAKQIISKGMFESQDENDLDCESNNQQENEKESSVILQRKPSGRKVSSSKTDEDKKNSIDSDILEKLKPQKGFSLFKQSVEAPALPPKSLDAKCYIQKRGKIDYGKMITDEVLFADYKLLENARKSSNVAGTTALIALIDSTKLTVANVGDSRGVLCDHKGRTIPLSFDHKPQSAREHKRIQEAGGFIAFKGVWRVSGILATSRALGDFPLKPNLVIANPDILEFDLSYHQPQFLILASDGLWDCFSNEEAVAFIKEHINEQHFGAKSITLASYARGSVDNISTIVVRFKNGIYEIGSFSDKS